jgi:HAMP domain-containing protein
MKFSVSHRITLAVAGLLLVGLASMVTVYYGLLHARNAVRETEQVYEPLLVANSAMGAAVDSACLRVLQYVDDPTPELRREALADCDRFESTAATYHRVTQSPESRQLANALLRESDDFGRSVHAVLTQRDERERSLVQVNRGVRSIGSTAAALDNRVNVNAPGGVSKQYDLKTIEQAAEHLELWVDKYLQSHQREYRVRLADTDRDLRAALRHLKTLDLTGREQRGVAEIERRLRAARAAVPRLLIAEDQIQRKVEALNERRSATYGVLRRAQSIVAQDSQRSRGKAEDAYTAVVRTTLFLIPIFLVTGLVAVLALVRSIIRPVRELLKGTTIVGGGDLTHRIGKPGHDELGLLAKHFNHMVAGLEATTVSRERLLRSEEELRRANLQS